MNIFSIPKEDVVKIGKVFFREAGLFIISFFFLFFDGTYFTQEFFSLQVPFNILMILAFSIMFFRSAPRIKELMIYAVILGFFGEYLFSKGLNMYTYRLGNIPLFVPFGHAVLYARVLRFSKASVVKKHHKTIEYLFAFIIIVLASIYLLFLNDIFGFAMTIIVFLLLAKRKKDRLFFFSMYILVALLEIGGTAFGVWKWPNIAFGVFEFLPSNNPPSGISLFYFLLDIGCFVFYNLRNKQAWNRLKKIRMLHKF